MLSLFLIFLVWVTFLGQTGALAADSGRQDLDRERVRPRGTLSATYANSASSRLTDARSPGVGIWCHALD